MDGGLNTIDELRDRLAELVEDFVAADLGRSVWVSARGATVGVADDVERPGASVNKVFVAIAVALAAERDELDLADTVAVEDLPPSVYPSITSALDPAHRFSVAELTGLMLATSDNRISELLVQHTGAELIRRGIQDIGCDGTKVEVGFADGHLGPSGRANLTTARDCGAALVAIATDPRLAWLRPPMRSSLFNNRILARLPDDVVVSHKTGSLAGVVNDVGIIHTHSGRIYVCFLTDNQVDAAATSAAIARCSRGVLDAVVSHDSAGVDMHPVS